MNFVTVALFAANKLATGKWGLSTGEYPLKVLMSLLYTI